MSHFNNNQYGNYYDPVGSQSNRPAGYSYQTSPSTAAYQSTATSSGYGSSYASNYQRGDGNTYNSQQYRANTEQQAASSATHAAAALSSLSNQSYNQTSSGTRASSSNQYDNTAWPSQSSNSNVYSSNNISVPNRTQSNNSPLYASAQSSSTFGRMSVPEHSQNTSNTFGASQSLQSVNQSSAPSNQSYQSGYTQQQSQPPRYSSPLHAVQAQQHSRGQQNSRASNQLPPPQTAQSTRTTQHGRQQSASVEPSPMTVDPSQVYDNRAELQRKAQIEAERRRKYEAEQAAKRAEEERVAAEKRKEDEAKQRAEKDAAEKRAAQQKKIDQKRKAKEEKKQSKSAATTLQQMASQMAGAGEGGADEEEMREMFRKMREFNAKNPSLLAKMWDEERKTHEATKAQPSLQQPSPAGPSVTPSAAPTAPAQQLGVKPLPKSGQPPKSRSAVSGAAPTKEGAPPSQKPRKPPASNASLWPPHKKSSLSEATARWLNAMADNANTQVGAKAVLEILNENPSYVELCVKLESLGVKFDRSQLARELLRAVPDGLKPHPAPPATSRSSVSRTASQVHGSGVSPGAAKGKGQAINDATTWNAVGSKSAAGQTVDYEAPLSLTDVAREVNMMHRPTYQSSHRTPRQSFPSAYVAPSHPVPNGSRPPSQSQPPEVKQEAKPEGPPRPPADKEEAARKRTFNDLVDLTAEDSEEEGPPPKKLTQAPPGATNGATPQPQRQFLQKPMTFDQFMHRQTDQGLATSPYFQTSSNGQIPPRAPIPGQQQANVTQQPAQPTPPPPVRQKGPTPEQLQQVRMRGKMLVEPIMRDRVARKSNYDSRTIARDVLLATGRHPDMRGLNAHLASMQKILAAHGGEYDSGGNRSDLATIKWDIIDPIPTKQDRTPASSSKAQDVVPEIWPALRQQAPVEPKSSASPNPDAGRPGIKRRGRPPKNSSPPADSAALTNGLGTAGSSSTSPARQASSRPTTPSSAPPPTMASGVGYAAFAQTNPDGTKKKGRPFGWKKNVHSREAQGLPKASHPAIPSRLKQTHPPPSTKQVEPQYQEYVCEWLGCKSSLINLETLKKHLVKVHGRPNEQGGTYECLWKGCKSGVKSGPNGGALFKNIEDWIQHVNREHVSPVAWKLGDGPKGGAASETSRFYASDSPPYLSDSRGRSVTPVISPACTLPPAQSDGAADAPVAKQGRPTKIAGTAAAEEVPELSALAEQRRLVGPLMERMGCVLASEERRATFLDDEDFEDQGWGSEHDVRE